MGVCLALGYIYKNYNPEEVSFFPKCPFYAITGMTCPGCGSQRALHYLLNLDLQRAAKENLLLVVAIPYILLGWTIEYFNFSHRFLLKMRKLLYGSNVAIVIFIFIIFFWAIRNLNW